MRLAVVPLLAVAVLLLYFTLSTSATLPKPDFRQIRELYGDNPQGVYGSDVDVDGDHAIIPHR